MNVASSTFTAFVAFALDKAKVSDSLLQEKTVFFTDQIKQRLHTKGLSYVMSSLLDEAFQLRLHAIKLLNEEEVQTHLHDKLLSLDTEITKGLSSESLVKALTESLAVYKRIIGFGDQKRSQGVSEPAAAYTARPSVPLIVNTVPSLADIQVILKAFGFGQAPVTLLHASLKYELSLIIAELHQAKELTLTEADMKELSGVMLQAVEDFGVSAVHQMIWELPEDEHNQTIRNIKIRVAMDEVTGGRLSDTSFDAMKNTLLN